MIVITGAAGLIGSHLIRRLNAENFNAIIAVDQFSDRPSARSLEGAFIQEYIEWHAFAQWLDRFQSTVEFIFHLGTAPHTINPQNEIPWDGNMEYAKTIWTKCTQHQIPLVYASSAAVYGMGEIGFEECAPCDRLKPLDEWGQTKLNFDKWAVHQREAPFYWAGLRLFTVYGPGDCCQSAVAPTVYTLFKQIATTNTATLCQSYDARYQNGAQMHDFIHVKDVVNICFFLMHYRRHSGFYNVGSGRARSFLDLANIVFDLLSKKGAIEFMDIPPDKRHMHPYFIEAPMNKLQKLGFCAPFYTLEEGLRDYLQNSPKHYTG